MYGHLTIERLRYHKISVLQLQAGSKKYYVHHKIAANYVPNFYSTYNPESIKWDFIMILHNMLDPPVLRAVLQEVWEHYWSIWPHIAMHVGTVEESNIRMVVVLWPFDIDISVQSTRVYFIIVFSG